jgi:hypothetical protein
MSNYLLNNDLVFYSMFAGTVGFIGYKFVSSYLNSFYLDKGVQTSAWEDYSDRPSQIGSNSITLIDTITPISENISPVITTHSSSEVGTSIITEGASTVTTVLPIPPINIEMVPNPDVIIQIVDISIKGYDYIDRASALADMLGLGFM